MTPEQAEQERANAQVLFDALGGTITPDEIRGILEARKLATSRAQGGRVNGAEASPALAEARAPAPHGSDATGQILAGLQGQIHQLGKTSHAEWQRHEDRIKKAESLADLRDKLTDGLIDRVERIEEAFHSIYTILVGYMK